MTTPTPAGALSPGVGPDGTPALRGTERIWYVLHSGSGAPALNMACDEALLDAAPRLGAPILRFYSWSVPAATFGYSQRYSEVQGLTPLRPLIRRPTGGGVVPHDRDWTYTLVFPPNHPWYRSRARDSYQRLHAWIQSALARTGLRTELASSPATGAPTHCFTRAEQFDVLCGSAKIAGAAQRRTRSGLLIQGSVQPPPGAERSAWETALLELAQADWCVEWKPLVEDEALAEAALRLVRTRYGLVAYNQRR